jgi:hypothetical protein
MKRLVLIAALAAIVAVPAALSSTPSDGSLSVKRGRGHVVLKFRGTVIGQLSSGTVQIKDFRPFDHNDPQFLGCKWRKDLNLTTTLCRAKGRKVTFRALDGRYTVNVRGNGIFLSVVGKGGVMVDGNGEFGVPDGVMSLNSAPYQSLPDTPTLFTLLAPPPGG